jgi:hypothetical protein
MLGLCVADSNSGTDDDLACAGTFTDFEAAPTVQRMAAVARVETQGLAYLAGAGKQDRPVLATAPASNRTLPRDGLTGSNQNGSALPVAIGHEI